MIYSWLPITQYLIIYNFDQGISIQFFFQFKIIMRFLAKSSSFNTKIDPNDETPKVYMFLRSAIGHLPDLGMTSNESGPNGLQKTGQLSSKEPVLFSAFRSLAFLFGTHSHRPSSVRLDPLNPQGDSMILRKCQKFGDSLCGEIRKKKLFFYLQLFVDLVPLHMDSPNF